MIFKPNKILWETVVGSHMWQMNRPDSDLDLYICYIADFRSFLVGNLHMSGHQTITEEVDVSKFEIGHIVNQIQKGNLNHLMGVMSPVVDQSSYALIELQELITKHPTKNAFNSIKGLAQHNIKHFLEEKKQGVADDFKLFFKKLNTITRSLRFGITLLEKGIFEFKPTKDTDPLVAYDLVKELEIAYQNSSLPLSYDLDIYEDYLLRVRFNEANLPLDCGK